MNEQDKRILEFYIKENRKKKIFCFIISIIFILIFLFYKLYYIHKDNSNIIENYIKNENIINENITKEENILNLEDTIVESKMKNENEIEHTIDEINKTKKEENIEETKEKKNTNLQSEKKIEDTKEKPKNKDFLFTDGYTMDNVTQIAQDYLKSFEFSGECVPIKDNEGVYSGMRVIFY